MAQKVITTSDVSGREGAESVTFALFGKGYEIDLTRDEIGQLEEGLKPYVKKARQIGTKSAKPGVRTELPADSKAVRAWAAAHGIDCPKNGRIPGRVLDAYNEAH